MIGAALCATGCQHGVGRDEDGQSRLTAQGGVAGVEANPAVALVNGRVVTLSDVGPMLLDVAGAMVLRDFVLDRAVDEAWAGAGRGDLPAAAIDRERAILIDAARAGLAERERGGVSDDALLQRVLQAGEFTPRRFANLLRRNAHLRALVQGEVTVPEAAVVARHQQLHGPRVDVSIIVVTDERSAQRLQETLTRTPADMVPDAFATLARWASSDVSSVRGGRLGAISVDDPQVPLGVRRALRGGVEGAAPPGQGQILGPVLVPGGAALVLVHEQLPASGLTLDQTRTVLRAELQAREEQRAMESLASRLLAAQRVTVMDSGVARAWGSRQDAGPAVGSGGR